jgi:metal-responsive CopG/Arc/MetJ family transcriptional regulator
MKHHIGVTIDSQLLKEIELIRGREKRSTFIEHLIVVGLRSYRAENRSASMQDCVKSSAPA